MEPFAYEEYRKNKIREKLEERATRIQRKKLPKVNTQLAEKLLEGEGKRANLTNPLGDDRFAAMFTNPDFTIDQDSEVGGGGRLLCVSVCLFLCACVNSSIVKHRQTVSTVCLCLVVEYSDVC